MARGISAFTHFTVRDFPGGAIYGCPYCAFTYPARNMGNAFRRAGKGKAAVRKHVLEKHPRPPAWQSLSSAQQVALRSVAEDGSLEGWAVDQTAPRGLWHCVINRVSDALIRKNLIRPLEAGGWELTDFGRACAAEGEEYERRRAPVETVA